MARIELKRAKAGEAVVTMQVRIDDGEVDNMLEEGVFQYLRDNGFALDVCFVDRPARGAVVINEFGADVEGPAEWAFEEVGEAQRAVAAPDDDDDDDEEGDEPAAAFYGAHNWWENAPEPAARNARFDDEVWWKQDAAARDARFELEVK